MTHPPEPDRLGTVDRIVLTDASTGRIYADSARDPEFRRRVLPDQAEPIPDLELHTFCPECDGIIEAHTSPATIWRCDHCRITWTPDGTGGHQT